MEKHVHCEMIKAWTDGAEIEIKKSNGCWESIPSPSWGRDLVYRIKSIKPSIDWSVLSDEFKWLAVDKNGAAFVFKNEPYLGEGIWYDHMRKHEHVTFLKSYCRGNCDWRDSLVERSD